MRRLIGLQYLRGIAALAVVAYHASDRAQIDFAVGKAGVDLFFVLSGFLMWAITETGSRPGSFLVDRVKRIAPPYWIVTSVMLAGALAGLFPAIRLTGWSVAASYLMVPAISPSNGQMWPLLAPGWTLEYEIAFYLLFAVALTLPRRWQMPTLAALLIGLAALHPAIPPRWVVLRYYTDAHILEFLAGLVLARTWQAGALDHPASAPLLAAATLVWIAGVVVAAPRWSDTALFGPPALFVVAAVLACECRPRGLPDWPPLRRLGDASYSIYLWHTLAISVTAKLAARFALAPVVAVPLHILCGVGVGLAGYALIERPLMAMLHRPRHRRGVPAPEGV